MEKVFPLSYLPNQEGFTFIGITKDGQEELKTVKAKDGIHYVDGFENLINWRKIVPVKTNKKPQLHPGSYLFKES